MSDYAILPVPELKSALKNEARDLYDFDQQLDSNNAFVYYLDSGRVILMPNNMYDKEKGIIFDNKKIYDQFASADSFPIDNENKALEEEFQEEIININREISKIHTWLADKCGLDTSNAGLPDTLYAAKKIVKSRKKSARDVMYSILLLGEYIRKCFNGRWILMKRYGTFNPYYLPGILREDGKVIVLHDVTDLFFTTSEIALEAYLKLPSINSPLFHIDSTRFKESFSGYKVISDNNH